MATKKNPVQIEIVEDTTGCDNDKQIYYRWQMWRSGRCIAVCPDGYLKKQQCKRTLLRLIATLGREDYVWKNGA